MRIPSEPLCRAVMAPAIALAVLAVCANGAGAAPSCRDVVRYLQADTADLGKKIVPRWGATPPTVRYLAVRQEPPPQNEAEREIRRLGLGWGGASRIEAEMLKMAEDDTRFAVWSINKALPRTYQLRVGATQGGELKQGEIVVFYAPHHLWPPSLEKTPARAVSFGTKEGEILRAAVFLNPDPGLFFEERERLHFLFHEMLHALGRGHVSPDAFPDTIMHPEAYKESIGPLKALDKAALRAVYGRLPVGTRAETLKCSQGRIKGSRQ